MRVAREGKKQCQTGCAAAELQKEAAELLALRQREAEELVALEELEGEVYGQYGFVTNPKLRTTMEEVMDEEWGGYPVPPAKNAPATPAECHWDGLAEEGDSEYEDEEECDFTDDEDDLDAGATDALQSMMEAARDARHSTPYTFASREVRKFQSDISGERNRRGETSHMLQKVVVPWINGSRPQRFLGETGSESLG